VHRSTLKYRLRRIREVSGHDLGLPDVQFNLQVATRAWRTLRVLRETSPRPCPDWTVLLGQRVYPHGTMRWVPGFGDAISGGSQPGMR